MSLYLVRSGNFITGLFHVPHAWFSFILPDSGMPSWFNARKGKASGFIACRAPAPSGRFDTLSQVTLDAF